jgi:hypothetical protein
LSNFYPIINFTNELIKRYKFKIKRKDAKEKIMSEVLEERQDGVDL